MLIGGLAMTLLSFGDNGTTPYIGVALLVICLMMLIYSTTVFQVRMEWLNMRRKDVQYYDRFAPSILIVFVFATFAFNGISKFSHSLFLVVYCGFLSVNLYSLRSVMWIRLYLISVLTPLLPFSPIDC